MVAMVEEDLRARPARAGVAHRPEVVRRVDADDPVIAQPGDLLPQLHGLVVGVVDGDQQLVGGKAVFTGDEVPRVLDRDILEVVAEGEIAEHFEKGVVARGIADVFEVVVLTARADALLRGDGPLIGALLLPEEQVLELHHPGVGEHERRVVARHQR